LPKGGRETLGRRKGRERENILKKNHRGPTRLQKPEGGGTPGDRKEELPRGSCPS